MAGVFTGQGIPETEVPASRPSVMPNEVLAGQELDANTNERGIGGPGLWTAPTATGVKTFRQLAIEAHRLTPAELEDLQHRLYRAGLYDDAVYTKHANPEWGRFDEATQNAYLKGLLEANLHPDKTFEQHLTERVGSERQRIASLQTDGALKDLQPRLLSSDVVPLSNINVDDPAALRKVANSVTRSLLGMDASDSFRDAFAAEIRQQQVAQGAQAQAQQVAAANTRAGVERASAETAAGYDRAKALGPDATADELGAFKDVVANEIVGPVSAFASGPAYSPMAAKLTQYGIDTETLAQWAAQARADGVAVPALSTPQAVELVVDDHVKRLYKQSGGDWTSVAHQFAYDIDAAMKKSRGGGAYGGQTLAPIAGRSGPSSGMGQRTLGAQARAHSEGTIFTQPHAQTALGLDPSGRLIRPEREGAQQATPAMTDLGPVASQIVASMGTRLGRAPGQGVTGGGVVGDNTPIFTGGQTVEQIDPAARAEEEIRKQRPGEVYEYGLMNVMQAFEQMLSGGR